MFALAGAYYPRLLHVIPRLRELAPQNSVEEVLEKLREETQAYPERYKQLLSIKFYLQQIIWSCQREWNMEIRGVTNYRRLFDEIQLHRKSEGVSFVTFNYDTLLEDAFQPYKRFDSLADYISAPDYLVIKLHGSVNWVRSVSMKTEDHDMTTRVIDRADELIPSTEFHLVTDQQAFDAMGNFLGASTSWAGGFACVPAIAIPLQNKDQYECPFYHVTQLEKAVSQTHKLLLIGWRATEEKFLKLLQIRLPKDVRILVVAENRENAQTIISSLKSQNIAANSFEAAESGFTNSLVKSQEIGNFIRG